MEHISSRISGKAKKAASPVAGQRPRDKSTERGELMRYFMEQLNVSRKRDGYPPLTLARMGRVLQAIPTKDLYYLKSVCDQAKDFSKKFWWEVNPKKHAQE